MDFQYREMGLRIKIRRKELKIKQAEMAEALWLVRGDSDHSFSSIIDVFICVITQPNSLWEAAVLKIFIRRH